MPRRILVLLLLLLPLASAVQAQPRPEISAVLLQHESVSGVPGRETFVFAVTYPPGSSTGWHSHHGDEYTAIIDGALDLLVEGRPPRRLGAGEAYHNEAGVLHDTRNSSQRPARAIATLVVEIGKPLFEPPPPGSHPTAYDPAN